MIKPDIFPQSFFMAINDEMSHNFGLDKVI